jgi:arylsulfatase A-like enzyme/Tfp pilus assembly protein PilF
MGNGKSFRMVERACWLACAGILLSGCSGSGGRGARPAGIVLITIDTLRADHLECYGYRGVKTPAINQLAADGVRFTEDISQAPLTLPSHCSILTGMWPASTGVRDQTGFTLPPDRPRLAGMLQSAGFQTAAFVGSSILNSETGLGQGFDSYTNVSPAAGRSPNVEGLERRGDQVMNDALSWIGAPGRGRFFAWIHLFDPHTPYAPPEPYASEYRQSPYDGEIAFVDAAIGRLTSQLRGKGVYEQTMIVLTSDHGEGLGEHGEDAHGFFLYDATLRVPLIVKLAESREKGRVVGEQVRGIDIAPTILEAAGVAAPASMQGRSLLALAAGRAGTAPPPAFSETYYPYYHFGWSPLTAIRAGRFKYIRAPRPELYDLAADRDEIKNLVATDAVRTAGLQAQLAKDYPAAAPRENPDPAALAKLKSLGYIGSGGARQSAVAGALADPKDKSQVYTLLARALEAGERGDLREANRQLREVLRQDGRLIDAHLNLGVNLAQLGDAPGAMESFRRALSLDPRNVIATYNLALAYAQQGRMEPAVAGFLRTLELDPRQAQARIDLGRAYEMQGRIDFAIAAFRRALDNDPNSGAAHYYLGEALSKKGLKADAEVELAAAQRLGFAKPGN